MDSTTPTTSSSTTTDDTSSTFNRQHEYNFFLDNENQKTLLLLISAEDDDDDTDQQPTTSVLLDNDTHPWSGSGWVHHRTPATSSATSVPHRSRIGPRINYVARYSIGNRSKDIPFSFHHYADPARYMEQYRRDYTYANNLDLVAEEDQFPWADQRLRQTTIQCQTGRTEIYSKRHSASSIDLQGQSLDWNHHRTMRDSTSVDGLSRTLRRNFEVFETSGPSSTNKFWTFDANHVLPVVYNNNNNNATNNNTVGIGRTRYLGGSTMELVGGLAAAVFSGKEAKHFPGNGFAIDDQSVKRLSSRVSNLQLPITGLRAIDILTHNSHARVARLTQQHRSLGVSTTLPVIR